MTTHQGDNADIAAYTAPHILIVEDDANYAVALMNYLKKWRTPSIVGQCEIDIAQNITTAKSYLAQDNIDIYLVDLVLPEGWEAGSEKKEIGKNFIREIISSSNAGVIVHSTLSAEAETAELLNEGADDYVQKNSDLNLLTSRILSLWRRIQLSRPNRKNIFAHNNRAFLIGEWKFIIGSRDLTNKDGDTIKLSQTEHAFLRHICTSQNFECDKESFKLYVLGRPIWDKETRIDNFVYRLRKKLGDGTKFVSSAGTYRLVDVREVKSV